MKLIEVLSGNLEKSFSVESGDGWYILYRAHLHLNTHGINAYEGARDRGDFRAQGELLICRQIIHAEEEANRATPQSAATSNEAKA